MGGRAESIIRTVMRDIADQCASSGHLLSEALIARVVRAEPCRAGCRVVSFLHTG